jgi:hypothetical protein
VVSRHVRTTGLVSSGANSSHPSHVRSDLSRPHALTVYDVPSVVLITSEKADTTCAMNRSIRGGLCSTREEMCHDLPRSGQEERSDRRGVLD